MVEDALVDRAEVTSGFWRNILVEIPSFYAAKGLVGDLFPEVVFCGVFEAKGEAPVGCGIEIDPLFPRHFTGAAKVAEAHLHVELIPPTFLAFAIVVEVFMDVPITLSGEEVGGSPLKHGAVIEKNCHRDHGLDHGCVPIPVCAGVIIFDGRIVDFAEHVLKFLLICW